MRWRLAVGDVIFGSGAYSLFIREELVRNIFGPKFLQLGQFHIRVLPPNTLLATAGGHIILR